MGSGVQTAEEKGLATLPKVQRRDFLAELKVEIPQGEPRFCKI